jgi:hypothetical protein
MFEGFENLQFSVFVPFVLKYFFYGDFLASSAHVPVENSAEGAFSGHTVDFIPVSRADRLGTVWSANLADFPAMNLMALVNERILLISLSPDILVEDKGLGGMDFESFAGKALLG